MTQKFELKINKLFIEAICYQLLGHFNVVLLLDITDEGHGADTLHSFIKQTLVGPFKPDKESQLDQDSEEAKCQERLNMTGLACFDGIYSYKSGFGPS